MILAEACRQDVDIHCSEVTPGDGKVHKCLVDHQDQLSAPCRAETNHLSMTAATNVDLNPSLGRACAPERAAHCKGVTPGKARVFNCLLANADKVLRQWSGDRDTSWGEGLTYISTIVHFCSIGLLETMHIHDCKL